MIIAKQMEIRDNIKKYFDIAYDGEIVVVPRKENKNVVIISESEYNRLQQSNRLQMYENSFELSRKTPKDFLYSLKKQNIDKLKVIKSMKKNWNGNGAPAFSKKLTDKVSLILSELTIQPDMFPTALSTIQFEYDNSRKDHMEIEISDSDMAEVFIVKNNGEELYEKVKAEAGEINKRVEYFLGKN